jgi:hypothetical protein
MPRAKPPKLTSPAERRRIADGAAKLNYTPALEVLGIAKGDRRWADALAMLSQIAANYLVARAAMDEETPARQIATLKARRQWMKAPPGGKKSRQPAPPLPLSLEMASVRDLMREIDRETPGLHMGAIGDLPTLLGIMGAKHLDAAIDRLDARRRNSNEKVVSTGRKQNWPRSNMLDQLEAAAYALEPSISRARRWKFISAFMVHTLGIKRKRLRADRLLPELRRKAQRQKMLKTEQAQVDGA